MEGSGSARSSVDGPRVPRRDGRAARLLLLALVLSALVWLANLLFIARNDGAKGFIDCGVHCSTTQNIVGGIFWWGGILVAILLVSAIIAGLIRVLRR